MIFWVSELSQMYLPSSKFTQEIAHVLNGDWAMDGVNPCKKARLMYQQHRWPGGQIPPFWCFFLWWNPILMIVKPLKIGRGWSQQKTDCTTWRSERLLQNDGYSQFLISMYLMVSTSFIDFWFNLGLFEDGVPLNPLVNHH